MDFIDKKQKVAESFNLLITEEISREEFLEKVKEFSKDSELCSIKLFESIFQELLTNFDELSRKDLKQRKLMVESFLY